MFSSVNGMGQKWGINGGYKHVYYANEKHYGRGFTSIRRLYAWFFSWLANAEDTIFDGLRIFWAAKLWGRKKNKNDANIFTPQMTF